MNALALAFVRLAGSRYERLGLLGFQGLGFRVDFALTGALEVHGGPAFRVLRLENYCFGLGVGLGGSRL